MYWHKCTYIIVAVSKRIHTDSVNLDKLCSEDKEQCDTGGDRVDSQNKKSGVYMGFQHQFLRLIYP